MLVGSKGQTDRPTLSLIGLSLTAKNVCVTSTFQLVLPYTSCLSASRSLSVRHLLDHSQADTTSAGTYCYYLRKLTMPFSAGYYEYIVLLLAKSQNFVLMWSVLHKWT